MRVTINAKTHDVPGDCISYLDVVYRGLGWRAATSSRLPTVMYYTPASGIHGLLIFNQVIPICHNTIFDVGYTNRA